jgi:zinc/manganese transport system substrate-binding protein
MFSRRSAISGLFAAPFLARAGFAQQGPMPVVATFSILADIVKAVGGEHVAVSALVGPDGDAHSYAPTPADARALAQAKLIAVNGLGFEGWIARLIRSSGTRAKVVTATDGVTPLKAEGGHGHSHGHAHGHSHGANDPHAWQNVANVKTYAANIAAALSEADPARRETFAAAAQAYAARLDALDAEVKAAISAIPAEQRRILTTHDAFRYYARAYGVEFIALRGVSSESEPSAREVAAIIRQVRERKVAAVFMENIADPRSIQRIAAETGAKIGGRLYSDALSEAGGPAATYIDLIRHNTRQIVGAISQA